MKHVLLFSFFMFAASLSMRAQTTSKGVDLSVFPNPTTEFISVHDDAEQVSEVAVYNLLGKKLKSFPFQKGENFFVGDLPKNMYLVQIIGRDRKVLTTQKLQKR